MFNKKFISIGISLLVVLIFFRCSSQEYTSAKLYIQQLEWEKAEEFLIKALVAEPDNPEIPYQLGYHIYALQKRDWKMMNQTFDKALSIDPDKKISAREAKAELKKLGIAGDLRRVLDGFVEAFRLDEEGLPRGHPYDLGV